jgi:hypothetical protein
MVPKVGQGMIDYIAFLHFVGDYNFDEKPMRPVAAEAQKSQQKPAAKPK